MPNGGTRIIISMIANLQNNCVDLFINDSIIKSITWCKLLVAAIFLNELANQNSKLHVIITN